MSKVVVVGMGTPGEREMIEKLSMIASNNVTVICCADYHKEVERDIVIKNKLESLTITDRFLKKDDYKLEQPKSKYHK